MAKSSTTFKPGKSGNPSGRTKGVQNRISTELKAIIHERGPDYLEQLFDRAKEELDNPKECQYHATKIVGAFVLKTIPSLKQIAVQADIRQEIRERIDTMSEDDIMHEARLVLTKYDPPEDVDES